MGPRRIRPLDGIRGLAVAGVLVYHARPSTLRGGFLGVEIFFVLSGFLLTSLLLDEYRLFGRINRIGYGARRLRRVAPAVLAFVVAVLIVAPVLAKDDAHRLPGDVLSSLGGFTNWHLIEDGSSYFAQLGRPSLFRHLWSLAIEIQFYVLCPFLVAWLARRRRTVAVTTLAAGIGASSFTMARLYDGVDPSRAYFGTDSRIGALLMGTLLGVVMARPERVGPFFAPPRVRPRADAMGLVGLAVLGALLITANERSRLLYPGGFLLTQVATAFVIAAAAMPGRTAGVLDRRVMRWLGARSYGIYLWHWPLVALLRPGIDVGWSQTVVGLVVVAGALTLGELSYRLIELPFLQPEGRLALPPILRKARAATAGAVAVAAAVVLVRVPDANPIVESIRDGEQLLATQPVSLAEPSPTTTTSAPVPTVAATAPPPAAPVIAPAVYREHPALTAIGDSVMLGAARPLHAKLGANTYIDAVRSRQFGESIALVQRLRAEGRLGQIVLVHLGHNGPIRANDLDALMTELAGVPHVRFVTVRVDRKWQDSVNQTLAAAASRYPTVKVVDWFRYSEGHREWFASDGTHLKSSGGEHYANLLAGDMPASAPPPPPPPPQETTTTTAPPPAEPLPPPPLPTAGYPPDPPA